MTARYRVTPRAAQDLVDIARYTRERWGAVQRDRYLDALEERFTWLAQHPRLGRLRPDVNDGYRSYPQGAHVIFYIVRDDAIDIIGLPHSLMDLEGYFGDPETG